MANRVLRDHSQPCEHSDPMVSGIYIGHPGETDDDPWCPGGREVLLTEEQVDGRGDWLRDFPYEQARRFVTEWEEVV